MRLAVPLIVLLALCHACDKDPGSAVVVEPAPPKPPPVQGPLPTTGQPKIRATREGLAAEIDQAEKDLEAGTKPPAHLVYGWKKQVEYLITATAKAIEMESEGNLRNELSTLREKQGQIDKARNDLAAAILETQRYLSDIQAGGKPPEGFTEDELKERLGERQEAARALEKQEAELRARMKEIEEVLAKGTPAASGPTLHTNELEVLKALNARIEKLEAALK